MRFAVPTIAFLLAWLGAGSAFAVIFVHKDWELACDNTLTCRAVGYQRDSDDNSVALMLMRAAGPDANVKGRLMIAGYEDRAPVAPSRVTMWINGKQIGTVSLARDDHAGDLGKAQTAALLASLGGRSEIVFDAASDRWRLSDNGASAVLLKMDEVQGRLGTPTALIRKGDASMDRVLLPVARPVVHAAGIAALRPGDPELAQRIQPHLKAKDDDCPDLKGAQEPLQIWRLGPRMVLVSAPCWRGAYNVGDGFWVANDRPPHEPRLVTAHASGFDGKATISASHKGRGPGDCLYFDDWTWNGRNFVHTASSTTGMCKSVAPGGAFLLPTVVTDVRAPQ